MQIELKKRSSFKSKSNLLKVERTSKKLIWNLDSSLSYKPQSLQKNLTKKEIFNDSKTCYSDYV